MEKDCVFCEIVAKKIPAEIIAENDNFIAFLDANPITEGHTLIIPKKHFVNIMDLPSDMASEMVDLIKEVGEKKINSENP